MKKISIMPPDSLEFNFNVRKGMGKKKPYSERTDLEKIKSQWKKTTGFLERGEWSSAIVRAATAAEIAANHCKTVSL
jgi:hypothetical protein